MNDELLERAEDGDYDAVLEELQRDGSSRDVAVKFDSLVRDLYWKAHDISAVVAVAKAGIGYCLVRMEDGEEEAERLFFGDHAKRLAYNLASFTWSGWDEPGISLAESDLAVGLDAARLNLRLAIELGKPISRVEDAHWLIGAHLLACGEPGAGLEEFQLCSPGTRQLYDGYVLLAEILTGVSDAQKRFDQLLEEMRESLDADGTSNAVQLATAYRVFMR